MNDMLGVLEVICETLIVNTWGDFYIKRLKEKKYCKVCKAILFKLFNLFIYYQIRCHRYCIPASYMPL